MSGNRLADNLYALVLLLVMSPIPIPAQPTPGDAQIEKYLGALTDRLSQRVFDGATTLAVWEARRPRLKQEYLDMLGLWPLPERTPLHATVTGTLEHEGVVIEKLHYQSKPGLYVTGNLYRPKSTASGGRKPPEKLPAVLYVCGHSGRGRDGNKTAFQDHGLWFATNGYVCFVVDTLQLGEVPGIHHGTYREGRWWWQARGYTPAGVECWNGVRGIDYLVSRPDVDAGRIAVTGISGGGAATFWIAAADERVKCAVPVSGMSDLESYVKNKVVNGHCDCMFLINSYGWEWTTIAALVAPRPMLFANSDNDRIFPMDGNRRIIDRLRTLYAMYGKRELVDDYVSVGGHDYRPDLRVAIFKWINKHIKGDAGPVKDADFKPLPGKELRVFAEDRDIPADALNGKIDETFVARAEVKLPEAAGFATWQKSRVQELRDRCFRSFPERIPPAVVVSKTQLQLFNLVGATVTTESGVSAGIAAVPTEEGGDPGLGVLAVGDEVDLKTSERWLKGFEGKSTHIVLARGYSSYAWTKKSPPNYVERAHALLGATVDQGRVWDIAATVRHLADESKGKLKWRIIGRGRGGILAAYAALFEPTIQEVVVLDPPTSHRDGPIFLNVERVLDVPEALGLLAPRPLTLVNATDPAFERTAQIYKLAGAEDKLRRK